METKTRGRRNDEESDPATFEGEASVIERRKHRRYPTKWEVHVSAATGNSGPFRIVDASRGGMFIAMDHPSPVGALLVIELAIGGTTLMVTGEVARQMAEPPGVGLKLVQKPWVWDRLLAQVATALDDSATLRRRCPESQSLPTPLP